MALYRFRVSFEDYDDVVREIDIKSYQAETDRINTEANKLKQIGNAGPIVTPEQVQPLIRQTIAEMQRRVPPADISVPHASDDALERMNHNVNPEPEPANGNA